MTDPRIIQLLEHISYSLDHLESIAEDIVDPHDYRLVQLQQSNGFIDQLLVALQTPDPVSPHSNPDKEATAPAGDTNQAAPDPVWDRKGPDLTPKAQEFMDWIESLDQESRWTLFQVIQGKFCIHCGNEGRCHCQNDL